MTESTRTEDAGPPAASREGGSGGPREICPHCGHSFIQRPYSPVFLDRLFDRIFRQGRQRPAACRAEVHGYSGYTEDCGCEHPRHGS